MIDFLFLNKKAVLVTGIICVIGNFVKKTDKGSYGLYNIYLSSLTISMSYLQALVDHFLTHITQSACTTKVILKRGSTGELNSYYFINAHFQIRGQRRQGAIL